jgi:hypothetical protein
MATRIKAILVDDEVLARERLADLLRDLADEVRSRSWRRPATAWPPSKPPPPIRPT